MKTKKTRLQEIPEPDRDWSGIPVDLSDETIAERKQKILTGMRKRNLDALIVYADLEHGSNFEYLVGYLPRFEEALLVLRKDGSASLVLGNENLNKAGKARIPAAAVHCPYFSLPNQPMKTDLSLKQILESTDLSGKRIGVVGWKWFTSRFENNSLLFDVPHYLIQTLQEIAGGEPVVNVTDLFIGEDGVRTVNNANEIAHYEYYSSLAGDCILETMDALKPGIGEMETADRLARYGQRTSVVTIAAFGERFIKGNMYPSVKKLSEGDTVSLTVGYRGGLSSRAGIAAEDEDGLPEEIRDYMEKLAGPYFETIGFFLENIRIGMTGGELWSLINEVLPQEQFHWTLNPGHLTAEEEWLCSPVYPGSEAVIRSGMIFQTDIIPSLPGYPSISAESTVCLADASLREQLKEVYPELWRRFENRRAYLKDHIGLELSEEILPMCSTLAYLRPFLLSRKAAVLKEGA